MDSPSALEVVICTYNNALMLDQALSALARQHAVPDGSWSCLVVDNNCTDETQEVIEQHRAAARIPGLRSVREPTQGLTPARLRGVRSSLAAWIAFVDDDCILEPHWIAQALAFTESHAHVGAFGGKVTLDFESEPPDYVRAYGYSFAEQNHGKDRAKVPFLVGAGLVVSRSAPLGVRLVGVRQSCPIASGSGSSQAATWKSSFGSPLPATSFGTSRSASSAIEFQ